MRLARLLHESGRLDEAVAAAENANRLDPDSHETFELLGTFYFERGEYSRAIAACRRATELYPYAQTAFVTLADSYLFLGRNEEAQAAVDEMERHRQEAWRRYQDKFSGQDRADAGF